ncbi:hypothetical protein M1523_01725 [Patescibacteria group bacterium]|nr:hypothetical protein [Patescibacteria group bacterium]
MNPAGKIKLIMVPPFVPHVVINRSLDQSAVIFELADAKMDSVTPESVI